MGFEIDFATTYTAPTFRNGVADVDSNGTGFYGLRINPSNTGNVRLNSRFHLADNIILTVDPSFQYTLANGGTQNATLAVAYAGRIQHWILVTSLTKMPPKQQSCPANTGFSPTS